MRRATTNHTEEQQPQLPGMPVQLIVATPSKLGAYEDCPRRFRYAYLDRPAPPKGPPWAHNSLGASLHNALRHWYELPVPERRAAAAPALLKAGWVREGYRDVDQEREVWRRALGWLESYLDTVAMPEQPLGVERGVAARTSVMAFSGRADRIDPVAKDGLAVIDYKAGRWQPTEDDARASAPLALYAFAAARVFRRTSRRVELHHLPTGTVATAELSEETIARQVRRAEATATDIRAAQQELSGGADPDTVFPVSPGPRCGWCDYRGHCPAGRDVPAKEPWAAVTAPANGQVEP